MGKTRENYITSRCQKIWGKICRFFIGMRLMNLVSNA